MKNRIGLRLEDKNDWECRVALIPDDVRSLAARGVAIHVQRFARRTFADAEYEAAGAVVSDELVDCDLVLGIKEMPLGSFRPGTAYMFFSHTIKGQPYNMRMLAELKQKGCTLFDHETVTDNDGQRLIFFGRHAGLAGMIDSLWTLGQRLVALGHTTPLATIRPAHRYVDLSAAKAAIKAVGEEIAGIGLPASMAPPVVGFTGYGRVSQGAQEIFDLLPHVEVAADGLADYVAAHGDQTRPWVKVVYTEEDLFEHKDPQRRFDLQHYYDHGEDYRSRFEPQLPLLTMLINGIFWNENYPKLASAGQLRALFAAPTPPRLLVVGDITCDIDGSLACTVRETDPGDPVYIYDPATRNAPSGFAGPGVAVMAVGNLPTELAREASITFSRALLPLIPGLAAADFGAEFEAVELPAPLRRAAILWRGELTPDYRYLQEYLPGA